MEGLLAWVMIQIAVIIALILFGYLYFDKRYKSKNKGTLYGGEFIKTNEVFKDPINGKTYCVYYNEKTGEREYIEDP